MGRVEAFDSILKIYKTYKMKILASQLIFSILHIERANLIRHFGKAPSVERRIREIDEKFERTVEQVQKTVYEFNKLLNDLEKRL